MSKNKRKTYAALTRQRNEERAAIADKLLRDALQRHMKEVADQEKTNLVYRGCSFSMVKHG